MAFERLAGVLLHPTSLPGGHGIGDLGAGARDFVDRLAEAGFGLWQILPLGPTGGSNSPYQSPSSFAGNPLLISLDELVDEHLLEPGELEGAPKNNGRVDFAAVRAFKEQALRRAHARVEAEGATVAFTREFAAFAEAERDWLDDYALFMTASAVGGAPAGSPPGTPAPGAAWWTWADAGLARREPEALEAWRAVKAPEIRFHQFTQFLFFRQWRALRAHAAAKRVKFVGDVPIYCAADSADVWAAPRYFELDADGRPERVAGVPPDYFCATGQLWGNPLYRWDALEKDGFSWWLSRLRAVLGMVDMLRIDHFRGFEAYWAVDAEEETAMNGRWLPGPGQAFFDAVREAFGEIPVIAEDLGVITPAVDRLRRDNGLPGMKVLQFAFCDGAEAYRPHTYEPDCVCYTATHDNDTTRGWYEAQGPDYADHDPEVIKSERDRARRYLGRDGSSMAWELMRLAFSSVATTAVAPMQDLLNLPNAARMNRPGTGEGQWAWRLEEAQLASMPTAALRDMLELYDRVPVDPDEEQEDEATGEGSEKLSDM